MRSNCGALRMPGELHASLGKRNSSRCQTGWTLKARDIRFFSLSTCYWDNFGKGTSDRFLRRRRSISNRITFWSTLPHTRFGRFGGHLRHGKYRRSGRIPSSGRLGQHEAPQIRFPLLVLPHPLLHWSAFLPVPGIVWHSRYRGVRCYVRLPVLPFPD